MPELNGKARVSLVFVRPDAEDRGDDSSLLRIATAIRGTEVFADETGRETELFGALTSGETFLYSPEGRLLFHGGITFGRSHEGDNPGISAIVEFVQRGAANRSSASVYGCVLTRTPKHQPAQTPSTAGSND